MKINISGLLENHAAGSIDGLAQWVKISTATAEEINSGMGVNSPLTQSGMKVEIDVDGYGFYSTKQTIYFRNWTTSVTDANQWVNNGWLVV